MKRRPLVIVLSLALLLIIFAHNNCSQESAEYSFVKLEGGTDVGNPKLILSEEIVNSICTTMRRCHTTLSETECLSQVTRASGFASRLGLSEEYPNMSAILSAEMNNVLSPNLSTGVACTSEIRNLACSEPAVIAAYVPSSSAPFSQSADMVSGANCAKSYQPGYNLEVPIELVDNGLASDVMPRTFLRTRTSLDTSDYDGEVSYSFEVVASNSSSAPVSVELINSNNISVAQQNVPAGQSSPLRIRTTFNPTAGSNNYRVKTAATSIRGQLKVFAVRIAVRQVGASKTKIYIPLSAAYRDSTSSSDDATAAVDQASLSQQWGMNADYYTTLWQKDSAAYSDLDDVNPYTLEVVMGATGASTAIAHASLFNRTTGLQIVDSQMTTTSGSPTLVQKSFSDSAAHFTNSNTIEFKMKNNGSNTYAQLYRAGLWVKIKNIRHAQIPFRIFMTLWNGAMSGESFVSNNIARIDTGNFSSHQIFHEGVAFVTAPNTPCAVEAYSIGSHDSGVNGSPVSGSRMNFNSTSRVLARSDALVLNTNDSYIPHVFENRTSGSCVLSQSRMVVAF